MSHHHHTASPDIVSAFQRWVRQSVYLKLGMLGFVSLLLMIPLSLVGSLTRERQNRKHQVLAQISQQWATQQTLTGPILNVPYTESYRTRNGEVMQRIRTAHFLPEQLAIKGSVKPQTRYRGIYKAVVYTAKLSLKGRFSQPTFKNWSIPEKDIQWDKAYVSFGMTDVKGIAKKVRLSWGKNAVMFGPGIRNFDLARKGISSAVPLSKAPQASYPFSMELDLRGTGSLDFLPLGNETTVSLQSDWKSPSFSGAFLPIGRKISEKGFSAHWKVLDMNRSFPQRWRDKSYSVDNASFGVKLFAGAQSHQKSSRIQKYSLVFLGCILLLLFFIEMLAQERLHVVHYGLFGLALCIFYLLQLALAEHIGFNLAYLVAALICVGILFAYARWVCRSKGVPWLAASIAGTLHLLFFTMLQLEDYALLLGSGVSVVVLVVVMNLSARLKLGQEVSEPEGALTVGEAKVSVK